jgi:hypothetical protein
MLNEQNSVSETRIAIARAAYREAGIECELPDRPVAPIRRVYLFATPDSKSNFSTEKLTNALADTPTLVDWEPRSQRKGLHYVDREQVIPEAAKIFTEDRARSEWVEWAKSDKDAAALIRRAARIEAAREKKTERGIE